MNTGAAFPEPSDEFHRTVYTVQKGNKAITITLKDGVLVEFKGEVLHNGAPDKAPSGYVNDDAGQARYKWPAGEGLEVVQA